MGLIEKIDNIEKQVQKLLNGLDQSAAAGRFAQGFGNALLKALEGYSLKELQKINTADIIAPLQKTWYAQFGKEIETEMAARLKAMVQETLKAYDGKGIDQNPDKLMADALRAKSAADIGQVFKQGMNQINAQLLQGTIDAFDRAVQSGTLDMAALALDIGQQTNTFGSYALTQARAALSAYNQSARNALAEQAGLKHSYYYGNLSANSRPFCRALVGGTFSDEQIAEMSNGMLDPVATYKGGWRCVHSWMPVDPAWDKGLKPSGDKVREVKIGKSRIRIAASEAAAGRVQEQAGLQSAGYHSFKNAASNDSGYSAIHGSWSDAYKKSRGNARKTLQTERQTGDILAELGHSILYNAQQFNNNGGPVDFILDGKNTELYTPLKGSAARAFGDKLHKGQSDYYLFRLDNKLSPEAWDKMNSKALDYNNRYGIKVKVLHNYNKIKLEDITP